MSVTIWHLAAIALLVGLGPCGWVCVRCGFAEGLVASQLAGTVAALALLVLAQGEVRQPFADLALILIVLSFVGSLVAARFLEESR